MVVLQRGDATIRLAKAIRGRLAGRMDVWEKGEVKILVQNTVHDTEAKLSSRQDGNSRERQTQLFQVKMLKGDVQGVVKYLIEMEKGGVLLPDDIGENSGLSVK
jgi:hypothetical protein